MVRRLTAGGEWIRTTSTGRRGLARFLLLGEPFHGTDRPYGLDRLRFVPLLELLRTLAHVLVVALARKRLLVPVQELCGRIDLVVVLAFRKHRHLVEVFGEPRRRLRNMDKAVLDYSGLRICPGGQTGTSHARRSVAREGTARRARDPPVRYRDKPDPMPVRGPFSMPIRGPDCLPFATTRTSLSQYRESEVGVENLVDTCGAIKERR